LEPAPVWEGCLRGVPGRDLGPVVGLELDGWDEPDLAVKAPVVEPVDVLGDGDLNVADGFPAALGSHHGVADALGLEQRVECLAVALS
jgi:hypothetical protein